MNTPTAVLLIAIAQHAALDAAFEHAGLHGHAEESSKATAQMVREAELRDLDGVHADAFEHAICGDLPATIAALYL